MSDNKEKNFAIGGGQVRSNYLETAFKNANIKLTPENIMTNGGDKMSLYEAVIYNLKTEEVEDTQYVKAEGREKAMARVNLGILFDESENAKVLLNKIGSLE